MTATVTQDLRAGLALHQTGRVIEAETVYSRVIVRDPDSPDAWHLFGRAAFDRKDNALAIARVVQAIRLRPEIPAFHHSMGEILTRLGRAREASLCFEEALRLEPGFVPALLSLGNALQELGRYSDAALLYGRAIAAQPDCAQAFTNLGNALRAQGCRADAFECYREAFRLAPENPEILVNLAARHLHERQFAEAEDYARRALGIQPGLAEGLSNLSIALLNQRRFPEAEEVARQAIEIAPLGAHLHSNLGSVLLGQERLAEAEAACRRALELSPRFAEAANNLGIILKGQDRYDHAAEWLESAVAWNPAYVEAWTSLGVVQQMRDRHVEAVSCFDEAIRLKPQFPKAHFCRGLALLRNGHLTEGFAEYEWRWKTQSQTFRVQEGPQWDGSPAAGKTILLFAEQGLGDTIQFARFAPLLAARCGRVIIECQPPLAGLLTALDPAVEIVTTDAPLPAFDAQAGLMSLPHILGVVEETIPAQAPYLKVADSDVDAMWKSLGSASGPRIGLAWMGNPKHAGDRHRSIPLATLTPLRDISGVEWFSLHVGERACAQVRSQGGWLREVLTESGGVPELAALMSCLDLIVSVDTMPAHLAGALGRPAWTLLSRAPDWRWQLEREDSPWYPTMRLFRQEAPGSWQPVVHRVAEAIRRNSFQEASRGTDMHE